MGLLIDRTGHVYDRLQAIAYVGRSKKRAMWLCFCDCGGVVIVAGTRLGKTTKSCGCLRRETSTELGKILGAAHKGGARPVHGHGGRGDGRTPTYRTWMSMMSRCTNQKIPAFKSYGALGVSVCDQWKSFPKFLEDMGERPVGTSLDRINPYGNYEPENCRWATAKVQANNRRKSKQWAHLAREVPKENAP